MPRLHCGLLARQAGDRDGARRELGAGAAPAQARRRVAAAAVRRRLYARRLDRAVPIRRRRLRRAAMTEACRQASAERAAELRADFDRGFADAGARRCRAKHDLLAIRVGTEPCAMRLSEIAGLFADRKITRVPGSKAALLGIAGFRGAMRAGLQPARRCWAIRRASRRAGSSSRRRRRWRSLSTRSRVICACRPTRSCRGSRARQMRGLRAGVRPQRRCRPTRPASAFRHRCARRDGARRTPRQRQE